MSDLSISPLTKTLPQSATEQVFRALYDAVVSLKLPPGTKVSEADIAKRLDVSRQPVRDAFFQLSKLGFLSIRPQRATLITRISPVAVQNAAFVRIALEVECLRAAAHALNDRSRARLRANLDAQREVLDSPDPSGFHVLDDAFHELICDIAGHPHAWTLIQEQKAHMDRVRFLTLSAARRTSVLAEHESILAALETGEMATAEKELRAHISSIHDVLRDIHLSHPDYFEVPR